MRNLKINTKLILILSLFLIPLTVLANSAEKQKLRNHVKVSCSENLPLAFRSVNSVAIYFDKKEVKRFDKAFQNITKEFKKAPPRIPMYDIMVTIDSLKASLKQYNGPTTHVEKLNTALERCKKDLASYIQKN